MQLKLDARRPTSSHWEELLEWPTVPHTAALQVWAKRLVLFSRSPSSNSDDSPHTTSHSRLTSLFVWSVRVIKFPSGFPTETLANRGGTYLQKTAKRKTFFLFFYEEKGLIWSCWDFQSSQMELRVDTLQDLEVETSTETIKCHKNRREHKAWQSEFAAVTLNSCFERLNWLLQT